MALTGPGGTGKTGMGVSAPRPLILLSERQGFPHIKQAAKRLGKPVPPVLLVEEAEDYRDALRALHGSKDKPFVVRSKAGELHMELPPEQWPQTVVLDSLSDACNVLVREIRKQSPQRKGRDGLPVDATKFWGVLIDRAEALMHGFRDLPLNVVFLCLMRDSTKEDEDGKILSREIAPKLATRGMSQALCAAVNVMGYTYRTLDKQKRPQYGVLTQGPEGMLTKPCAPLLPREVPDLTSWFARMSGELVDAPTMPLAPESMEQTEEPKALPAPQEEGAGPQGEPDPAPTTPGYLCSNGCGALVEDEGAVCARCEAAVFGDSGTDPEPEAAAKVAKMVPCEQCGRRMSTNTNARTCEADGGSVFCVPMKTADQVDGGAT